MNIKCKNIPKKIYKKHVSFIFLLMRIFVLNVIYFGPHWIFGFQKKLELVFKCSIRIKKISIKKLYFLNDRISERKSIVLWSFLLSYLFVRVFFSLYFSFKFVVELFSTVCHLSRKKKVTTKKRNDKMFRFFFFAQSN